MKKVCLCLAVVSALFATPENPVVVSGDVSFAPNAQLLEVTASNRAIVEWEKFSIGAAETVRFLQPSEMSVVLNRVTGIDVSTLSGTLQSNGTVYLINPRGVIVGAGAVVDTAGFLATTLDVDNGEFLAGGDVLFTGSSDAMIVQQGVIRARDGDVILMAHAVRHEGTLEAHNGSTALIAGHEVLVKPAGMPLLTIRPDLRALSVENIGSIEALNAYVLSDGISRLGALRQEGEISLVQKGGKIILSNSVETGEISQTAKLTAPEGTISISTGEKPLGNSGILDVSGAVGGTITISGEKFANGGSLLAEGREGAGGTIALDINQMFLEIAAGHVSANGTTSGGTISISAPSVFTSGTHEAAGGTVQLLGSKVTLAGATVSAQEIVLGGNDVSTPADEVYITRHTQLLGNPVHIWANETLNDYTSGVTPFPSTPLIDPTAASGTASFGSNVVVLSNGNIVVTKPSDNFGAMNAGAFFLYNGNTAQLMSSYFGSHMDDQVANPGITPLNNNNPNFVVRSIFWNGTAPVVGAATWASGTASVLNVTVSSSNSLVGSSANDLVGTNVTALTNGHYVVQSSNWHTPGGGLTVGAATWGNGLTGVTGTVSATNSLIGSFQDDGVGSTVVPLSNGNYVTFTSFWNGGNNGKGAATWGSGTSGVTGTVSASNSLVGSTAKDFVSGTGLIALANGNYVVSSSWANGAATNAGAATWGNGTTGVTGTVSAANSLVGTTQDDNVGQFITALTNPGNTGNYVVESPHWTLDGTHQHVGAATWSSGSSGITGTVTTANSLLGSRTGDAIGDGGITALTNGNYVVIGVSWSNGVANVGHATWGNGTMGTTGTVSASSSLVGTRGGDFGLPHVVPLVNGNYVVENQNWNSAVGAATWGSGTTGVTGTISASNSLIGTNINDSVASSVVALKVNGNYVVGSQSWNGGVGAVTWGSGTTGVTGTVSAANSLVGSQANDVVGNTILPLLVNGNYVVSSTAWNNTLGALTWGSGTNGVTGTVSINNSLIGTTTTDFVGNDGIQPLNNGNYVALTSQWSNPAGNMFVGAATWGSGTTGVTGTVSIANSLIGTTANDQVSLAGSVALGTNNNNNYLVGSDQWDSTLVNAGAVTFGNGATGTTGTVSIVNGVVGTSAMSGLSNFLDNPAVSGTFVVQFLNTPAVVIGGIGSPPPPPPPPPSPSPSPSTPAHDDASARTQFSRAIAESFYDWNTRLFGPYLSNDPWPPLYTAKGLLVNLPSLVLDDPWEPHSLLQTK